MSSSHSIGSLETWEPEDKSFTKHVLTPGSGDTKPNEGSVVTVQIMPLGQYEFEEGSLGDYKMADSVEVTLGEGDTAISELLDSIIMSMTESEVCYIKTKMDPKGNKVNEVGVDTKSMKFNVTLNTLNRAADKADLEKDELLDRAHHHKDGGAELYKADRIPFAVKRFNRSLDYLLAMEPFESDNESFPESLCQRHDELKCQCYNNLAACYLKLEQFEQVVENSTRALECSGGENVKALFRRGQASAKLHNYDRARADLGHALKLEPENKAVWNQLRAVDELIKKEKQMYRKMFVE